MVVVAGSVVSVLVLVDDGGSEDGGRRRRLFECSEEVSEDIAVAVGPFCGVIRGRRCVEVALV